MGLKAAAATAMVLATVTAGCARAEGQAAARETLTIETQSGAHRFAVEIADDPQERERGLMFRKSMGRDEGMLFEWPASEPRAFWMRNTLIPLDILFLDETGQIVSIARDAVPLDETPLPSYAPAKGVLEINGGMAAKLGVRPGDRVVHPFFKSP